MTDARPQLTFRALAAGCALGALLAATNIYVGLKIGFIDSGAVTAALLGFAIVVGVFRSSYSEHENNVTAACAASAAIMVMTTGLFGPIAALALLGHDVPWWAPMLLGLSLGTLGTLMGVLLRRPLIVEQKLPFPSGTVLAQTIVSLHGTRAQGLKRAIIFGAALAGAGLFAWLRDGRPTLLPQTIDLPGTLVGLPLAAFTLGIGVSPLMLSTGVLIGARIATSIAIGAVCAWGVLAPILVDQGIVTEPSFVSFVAWLLWPGAALIVSSSLVTVAFEWRALAKAVADVRSMGTSVGARRWYVVAVLAALAISVIVLATAFGASPAPLAIACVLSVVLTMACLNAAGATDQAPVGAMGGLTQIATGPWTPGQTASPLSSGALVSGVATSAVQMAWSFKAGEHLGTNPRNLVVAQLIGIVVGAAVVVPVFALLQNAYGLGTEQLPAGAVLSWKATAEAVSGGLSDLPAGAPLAAAIAGVVGTILALLGRTRLARFLPSPIALGVAFLIPAAFSFTMLLGAIILVIASRAARDGTAAYSPVLAAGGIAGEALIGLVIALLLTLGVI